jgi:formyltetrahydrofolate deformylase
MSEVKNYFILTATCRARTGVIAAVTSFLADRGCYISTLEQFDDEFTDKFFLRSVFRLEHETQSIDIVLADFTNVAEKFSMDWKIYDPRTPVKTIIMVSKYDHCLDDILYRKNKGEFNMEVVAIVSNHEDLKQIALNNHIPFVHLPIKSDTKSAQEQELKNIITEAGAELVVLARYMQILSNDLVMFLSGRCINIHHSFLPGFKGAKPYHQAFDRGVKVIGATAHFVTADLDEGPIIEQILTRVDHNHRPEQLIRIGRDNESMALAKAITYFIERRVFLDGKKTIVFHAG